MNCHVTLTKRVGVGKGVARQLRREGNVPGVLYGKGEAVSLTITDIEFSKLHDLRQQGFVLVALAESNDNGAPQRNAILKDVQYDPVTGKVLHVDFFEVAMDQAIQVSIPIVLTGSTPIGVTLGGVLRQRQRHLLVEGLPAEIPDTVCIDGSALEIGHVVKIKDLPVAKGLLVRDDLEKIIFNITSKKQVAEVAESKTGESTQEPNESKEPAASAT